MTTPTRTQLAAAATLFAALLAVTHPARAQNAMPMQMQPQMQPPMQQPMQPGVQGGMQGGGPSADQLSAWERRDMGVPPSQSLHEGAPHGPTPTQIPGGQVITTRGLAPLLQQQQQGLQVFVFDVLGSGQSLPNAIPLAWAAQPGSFNDQTQQRLDQTLRQVTRGQADAPLVFYCMSAECWMSYNAALRAIKLGYRNVLWYRGGIEAWSSAGLPMGQGGGMQGQNQMQGQGPMQGGMQGGMPGQRM